MKRVILIAMLSMICVAVSAQKKDKAEKQAEFTEKLIDAIKNTRFTFSAMSMKPSLGKLTPVDVPEKDIDVVPGHIVALLPYDDAPSTAYDAPEYVNIDEPDFEAAFNENEKQLFLTLTVKMARGPFGPNSKVKMEFRIKKSNGSASVEIIPDVSNPIVYNGTVLPK